MKKKECVKVGDKVQLTFMIDTMTKLRAGDRGTVFKIDEDQELIWVKWDNGEELALLQGIDKFTVVEK